MFDQNTIKFGIKIQTVEESKLAQAPSVHNRRNVIQISILNQALLWDLDKNEEIVNLTGLNQFVKEENFVRTGFDIHIPYAKSAVINLKNSFRIMSNASQTIFTQTRLESQGCKYTCFNLYSDLCVREMLSIQSKLKRGELIRKIDEQSVLAEIKGHTIFSIFLENAEIFDLIY